MMDYQEFLNRKVPRAEQTGFEPGSAPHESLIVAPLGVRQEFIRVEGPAMGMEIAYCRNDAEVNAATTPFIITNYERVRDGGITLDDRFAGAGVSLGRGLANWAYHDLRRQLRKLGGVEE